MRSTRKLSRYVFAIYYLLLGSRFARCICIYKMLITPFASTRQSITYIAIAHTLPNHTYSVNNNVLRAPESNCKHTHTLRIRVDDDRRLLGRNATTTHSACAVNNKPRARCTHTRRSVSAATHHTYRERGLAVASRKIARCIYSRSLIYIYHIIYIINIYTDNNYTLSIN